MINSQTEGERTQPAPLSAEELERCREIIHSSGFPSYSGLDENGDSKTPYHEGRNEAIDDCFLATAHIVAADRRELASLRERIAVTITALEQRYEIARQDECGMSGEDYFTLRHTLTDKPVYDP